VRRQWRSLSEFAVRDRDGQLVALAAVAEVKTALDRRRSVEAFAGEVGPRLRFQLEENPVGGRRCEVGKWSQARSHIVVQDVGAEEPECRKRAGIGRHQDSCDPEFGRDRRGMQRTGAAERHQHERRKVDGAFGRLHANSRPCAR
jgi:hypothetical protein